MEIRIKERTANLTLEIDELISIRNMAKQTNHINIFDPLDQAISSMEDPEKEKSYKVLDIYRKGNVVKFYLGDKNLQEYHGDDWDDFPYELNAGPVYDKFVSKTVDVAFPYDISIYDAYQFYPHLTYSKNEFIKNKHPYLIGVNENKEEEDISKFILGMLWIDCQKVIRNIKGVFL